ncbi:MAG: DNA methyltransferase [Kofleriaceae bacterium]
MPKRERLAAEKAEGPRAPRTRDRRSLSMPRAQGRIFADGDRDLAEGLVAALRAPAIDHEVAESLTHPFHTYPARLHPATARVLVDIIAHRVRPNSLLVDPFCGSGTTLVEARAAGLRAVGTDLNPLAVLVARAKTWTVPSRRRQRLRDLGHEIYGTVLAAGKAARRADASPAPLRKPKGFDPNARDRRLAAWFAPHVRRELELLASMLDELRGDGSDPESAEYADVLTACLSAILYKVSSRTSDTDGTWVDKQVGRGAAARHFMQRVELLYAGLTDLARSGGPPDVHLADARRLGSIIPDGTASAILTSPPYAGTYDYAEHQRLRFDFLGLRHRDFDAGEIGSRRSFLASAIEADRTWRKDLGDSLDTITSALEKGGLAAIVIGDSWAGGRAVYALDDIRAALSAELVVLAWASQERPALGGERKAFGDRPKAEHVVLLERR